MLEIKDFRKTYPNGKVAVDGLSLRVESGDIVGFIGHNGAGKTTTIRASVGVLAFDEGEILIDGHSIRAEPIRCKQILAYIPDEPTLYNHMTGTKYLNFVADMYRVSEKDREERVHRYAEQLEFLDSLNGLISSYSHGMKQKLAIISALIHDPKLLIMDEPFVGLDPIASRAVKETMREKCAQGCSVFFSTHVLEVAEKLCDKVAIIKNGRLVAFGEMDAVRGDSSLETVFFELEGLPND